MQIPLQITVRDMAHSPALDEHLRAKARKLEQFFSPIVSCHVLAEALHKHQHHGRHYTVRLDIGLPGKTLVVNHDHDEDIYIAVREAFNAARRQLEDYAQIRRGEMRQRRVASRGAPADLEEQEND